MIHGPGPVLKPAEHTTPLARLSRRLLVVVRCRCHRVSIVGIAARIYFRLWPYVMSMRLPYLCTVCDTACSRR